MAMVETALQQQPNTNTNTQSSLYEQVPPALVMGLALQIAATYHQSYGVWLNPQELISQVGGAFQPGNSLPPDTMAGSSSPRLITSYQHSQPAPADPAGLGWAKQMADRVIQAEREKEELEKRLIRLEQKQLEMFEQASTTAQSLVEAGPARPSRSATGVVYSRLQEFHAAAVARIAVAQTGQRPVSASLKQGCELLLTVLLAWQHFDLFRERGWLILSFDRIVRELRSEMSAKTEYWVKCLHDLQRADLVEVGRLETGIISDEEAQTFKDECRGLPARYGNDVGSWWTARGIQRTRVYAKGKRAGQEQSGTNIYRLPDLDQMGMTLDKTTGALERPCFDPLVVAAAQREAGITSRKGQNDFVSPRSRSGNDVVKGGNDVGMTSERREAYPPEPGMTSERREDGLNVIPEGSKRLEGENEVVPTSFPRRHDLNHDLNMKEGMTCQDLSTSFSDKKEPLETAKVQLEGTKKETYELLLGFAAHIPNYNGSLLDEKSALALANQYPLEVVQDAIQALNYDMGRNAEYIRDPLAVFRSSKLPKSQKKFDLARNQKDKPEPTLPASKQGETAYHKGPRLHRPAESERPSGWHFLPVAEQKKKFAATEAFLSRPPRPTRYNPETDEYEYIDE